jgi:hypothetical protein
MEDYIYVNVEGYGKDTENSWKIQEKDVYKNGCNLI